MGALKDYIEREFGRSVSSKDYEVSVKTTPTKIVNNNPDRLELIISNPSSNLVYIGLTSEVSLTRGIFIPTDGGSQTFLAHEDGDLVGREWWAIASANTNLYIIELEAR